MSEIENEFLRNSELTLFINGNVHEIDSITDCKRGINKHQIKLELDMCCDCCSGRTLLLSYELVMQGGNPCLQELAR